MEFSKIFNLWFKSYESCSILKYQIILKITDKKSRRCLILENLKKKCNLYDLRLNDDLTVEDSAAVKLFEKTISSLTWIY